MTAVTTARRASRHVTEPDAIQFLQAVRALNEDQTAALCTFMAEHKTGGRDAWFRFAKGLGHDDAAATAFANEGADA